MFNKDSFSNPPTGTRLLSDSFRSHPQCIRGGSNLLSQETFDIFVSEMNEIMFKLSRLWSFGDLLHFKSSPKRMLTLNPTVKAPVLISFHLIFPTKLFLGTYTWFVSSPQQSAPWFCFGWAVDCSLNSTITGKLQEYYRQQCVCMILTLSSKTHCCFSLWSWGWCHSIENISCVQYTVVAASESDRLDWLDLLPVHSPLCASRGWRG